MNITLDHNGTTYLGEVGTVERTLLGYEDHGLFTGWLFFNFNGSGQGFGGRYLEGAYAAAWIKSILNTVGVREWESVKGVKMVALRTERYGSIEGIANLNGTEVFIAQEHADEWFDKTEGGK